MKRMREIKEIIIHCSATREGMPFTVKDIDKWHKERGFSCIGYHYVIYLDGEIVEARPLNKQGAHCIGHNANSIGVCYIGGLDKYGKYKDTRTEAQKRALKVLIGDLSERYPGIKVHGHNELANKACPCFDVSKEFGEYNNK